MASPSLIKRTLDRSLAAFGTWFESGAGVWQTLVVVVLIVLGEATGLLRDPNGFWLLYWLTVYSAVTQPALAHSGAENSRKIDQALAHLESLVERIDQLIEHQGETPKDD